MTQGSGPSNTPNPAGIFMMMNAYQQTAALKGAIELELFTAIGEGNRTASAIARRCGASERGVRILCDYLATFGLIAKREGGYELTPDSAAFLDRRSPAYLGGATEFLLSAQITDNFKDVPGIVRKGGTLMPQEGTLAPEHPVWVKFARAMAPLMVPPAQQLAELVDPGASGDLGVLDIAAGHGLYGISFAVRNPKAQVTALDWAPVLEVAKQNANRAGVSGRFHAIAGSAFEANLGGPYDVVLLPNFLHHFDAPTIERLLNRIRPALAAEGRVAILEFIPDEDRTGPPPAVWFAFQMLSGTPAGDAYTFSEYERMLHNAGFGRAELHSHPQDMHRLVIARL
jgi:predicted nicotinamide N-methyase